MAKAAAKAKVISLEGVVTALDDVQEQLRRVKEAATEEDKKKLTLKINTLKDIRKELVDACGHAFPVWPLAGKRRKS